MPASRARSRLTCTLRHVGWVRRSTGSAARRGVQAFMADVSPLDADVAAAGADAEQLATFVSRMATAFEQADGGSMVNGVTSVDESRILMPSLALAAAPTPSPAPGPAPTPPPPPPLQPLPGPPPPPPPPEHGDGSGDFGSRAPTWHDRLVKLPKARFLIVGAELRGYTDAARHLRHYLGATGKPLKVDAARVLTEVRAARLTADALLQEQFAKACSQIRNSSTGTRFEIPFQSRWGVATASQEEEGNWFFALGSFSVSQSGVMVVEPSTTPGGEPTVRIHYQTHIFDRYNWDAGKNVTIRPATIEDKEMQELHKAGLAREYEVHGSTDTQTVELSLSQLCSGSTGPAPPDPGRGGGRSDPSRLVR